MVYAMDNNYISFIYANSLYNCILVFSCSPAVFTAGIFFGEKTKKISEKTAKKVSVHKNIPLPLA